MQCKKVTDNSGNEKTPLVSYGQLNNNSSYMSTEDNTTADSDNGDELLLPQQYSLKQLEEAVEYEVADDPNRENTEPPTHKEKDVISPHCGRAYGSPQYMRFTDKTFDIRSSEQKYSDTDIPLGSGDNKSPEFIKPLKVKNIKPKSRKRKAIECTETQYNTHDDKDGELEYVKTPANGYYYVVRHSVKECPMCYTLLSPASFSVNIVTLLITAVCSGCNLMIYIVNDPPDGSASRVAIITNKDDVSSGRKSSAKKPHPSRKHSKHDKYQKPHLVA